MKYDQYVSLIQSLETFAKTNKRRYELNVSGLIALGYGYFIGLICLLFVPLLALILGFWFEPGRTFDNLLNMVKLWWLVGPALGVYFGFLGSAISSITAKVPDPAGRILKQSDAPELFEFVRTACRELKAKRPKIILIDDSFNASVATLPRVGIFGQKVIMLLGLPLMKALSADQFKAVVAHEIGHISGKHGSFAKWAYQMREAWGRLIESQETMGNKLGFLYEKFVGRFFPYFTAYSFVLMREHEKEADREAARLVGEKALGESLILLSIKGRSVEEDFWRTIHEENIASDVPVKQVFSRMIGSLSFVDPVRSKASLQKAIEVPTDFNDSHPSLADRLRLIGYWTDGDLPKMPGPTDDDAASVFLSSIAASLTSEFDTAWDEHLATSWADRHTHFQQSQQRVDELASKRLSGSLTLEELIEAAALTAEKDGFEAVVPILDEAVDRFPNEAVAWFNRGGVRLSLGDGSGLADLEKAVELDPTAKAEAYQMAFGYLRSRGDLENAKKYASYLEEQDEVFKKARAERQAAQPNDSYTPHDLSDEFIEMIPKKLAGMDEIKAIYAANKVVRYMPEHPFRVVFVELRPKQKGDADTATIMGIVNKRLDTGEVHFVVIVDNSWRETFDMISQVPGSKIYEKPSS